MKTVTLFAILFLLIMGLSCKKETLPDRLNGQWIRTDHPSDTITFGYGGNDDWFTLNRGYVIGTDGIRRPIIPFGIYAFKIQNDSISVQWSASSSLDWPTYFFMLSGSKIEMGNFIEHTNSKIIFEKLK